MVKKINLSKVPTSKNKQPVSPIRIIVISFFCVITTGALLLKLPFATVDGNIPLIDAFFTATSATCVTGLVVFDTFAKFTFFGQLVIIAMIQIGGLGLVTFTTFFSLIIGKRLGLHSLKLAGENAGMPNFAQMKEFIRKIIMITFACELVGAVLFMFVFIPQFGLEGIWISLFTAISAFCNAGFDLFGQLAEYSSLTTYASNWFVLAVVSLLIISGGLGFIVWNDLLLYKKNKKIMLHSKIVLLMTVGLILVGTVLIAGLEWNNPNTLGSMSTFEKISNSMFQSITSRTAGFNSIDLLQMDGVSKFVVTTLMFIGAAPGSTGGGIKVTTVAILIGTVASVVRGKEETTILGRQINKKLVYRSLSITVIAMLVVLVATTVLMYSPMTGFSFIDYMFEAVSAFGTVGLTVGVTVQMESFAKMIMILTMFIGRVGPVTFAVSLAGRQINSKKAVLPEGNITIG